MGATIRCSECGAELAEVQDGGGRLVVSDEPCPVCGASRRTVEPSARLTLDSSMSAEARVFPVWDSSSLTLFAAIYAILVTVAGVIVAMVGSGRSWLWWGIYVALSLGGLTVALLFLPGHVIRAMRWLVER